MCIYMTSCGYGAAPTTVICFCGHSSMARRHTLTQSAYSIINERAKGKRDRAGYPAAYDYTFAYGVSAAADAVTASTGYRETASNIHLNVRGFRCKQIILYIYCIQKKFFILSSGFVGIGNIFRDQN